MHGEIRDSVSAGLTIQSATLAVRLPTSRTFLPTQHSTTGRHAHGMRMVCLRRACGMRTAWARRLPTWAPHGHRLRLAAAQHVAPRRTARRDSRGSSTEVLRPLRLNVRPLRPRPLRSLRPLHMLRPLRPLHPRQLRQPHRRCRRRRRWHTPLCAGPVRAPSAAAGSVSW